jgi:hypothetical protein
MLRFGRYSLTTMRTPPILMLAIVLLGFVGFAQSSPFAQNNTEAGVFPLSEGTSWVYQGIVRWADNNSDKVSETQVTWTSQLKRVIRREHLTAAMINGFPTDLDWSDGHPQPADSLIVISDRGDYYLVRSDDVKVGLKRLGDSSDSLQDFLSPDNAFLRLPLVKGKKFCDPEGMARDDGMYCWVVSSIDRISLLDVKGLEPKKYQVYEVSYRTNPDDMELQLLPGVGLIGYSYHHHGTVADTELNLIAFRLGDAK